MLTYFVRPAQVMGKNKVLVKVHPEGKYVVDLDKSIDIAQVMSFSPCEGEDLFDSLHMLSLPCCRIQNFGRCAADTLCRELQT